jgi:type II secretory pathway pseudopilin PulG
MTTLLVMIIVLVVISLALDVLILASLGNMISRRTMTHVAEQLVRAAQETAAHAKSHIPYYDA